MRYRISSASCYNHDELIKEYPDLMKFGYTVTERLEPYRRRYDSYININTFEEFCKLVDLVGRIVVQHDDAFCNCEPTILIYDNYIE